MIRQDLQILIKTHQAEVYRYLRYLGAWEPALAEDLTQETFLAVFQSKNVPDDNELRRQAAFIRGVARNIFLMHCRKLKADPVRFSSETVAHAEDIWTTQFLRSGDGFNFLEALRRCLHNVPPKSRDALQMRYWKKQSRTEMAQTLQMSEDGVKSLLRRIRAALKKCVEGDFEDPIAIFDGPKQL